MNAAAPSRASESSLLIDYLQTFSSSILKIWRIWKFKGKLIMINIFNLQIKKNISGKVLKNLTLVC